MSVRAYRVDEIKTNGVSFNLWHDVEVTRWLKEKTGFFQRLNGDFCGLAVVGIDELEAMLSEIGPRLDDAVRESIEEDIEFARASGKDYVQYICY